jgi:type IV pilus biogenesis protein CpaD/CtpE
MMTRTLALAFGLSLLASGCALNSAVDEQWGRSTASNQAALVADPNAPANDDPVLGMDAKSAEAVAERYYEGQRNQGTRQAPTITISD